MNMKGGFPSLAIARLVTKLEFTASLALKHSFVYCECTQRWWRVLNA